ncbi:hypothetical protein T492DRAFT_1147443 [Pavlovales sp. CCMP2436]|nr:hypothetical protein T492DRAFT_1147443 [Pavlovales sp. CCMP2436]
MRTPISLALLFALTVGLAPTADGALLRSTAPALARAPLVRRPPSCMKDGDYGDPKLAAAVDARRKFTAASKKKFDALDAQAEREPTDRTAGLIVAGGLLIGIGGAIGFAAANGYLTGPTLR